MSRTINWDEELSDDDRAWAEQRPDDPAGFGMTIGQRLRANDEKFGREAKVASQSRAERIAELRAQMADAQNEIERLTAEQAQEDNPNVAVTGNPASGLVRDNTGVDGQPPAGAPEAAEDYSDTKYWTVARLQQEIDARNADREQAGMAPLGRDGRRPELVERLLKDDEEIAASEQEQGA